jgi:hypothetical protein
MSLPNWIEPRLGPQPKDDEQFQRERLVDIDRLVAEAQRRFSMERVRAKFTVSEILTDKKNNSLVKLYAAYKGDESSPENESFSNSTPFGSAELYITNPAAIEFFEKLAGKYVYLDFTEATAS